MGYSHYFRSTGQKYKEIEVSSRRGVNKWIIKRFNPFITNALPLVYISKKVDSLQFQSADFSY